jgi:hypothetical protein
MKIVFRASERLTVEVDADNQKELFKAMSAAQELVGEAKCGACGSENLRFVVRHVEGNDYYELRCADCGAVLQFGQHKAGGTLFPRRKDKEGNWLPNRGWTKYQPSKREEPF